MSYDLQQRVTTTMDMNQTKSDMVTVLWLFTHNQRSDHMWSSLYSHYHCVTISQSDWRLCQCHTIIAVTVVLIFPGTLTQPASVTDWEWSWVVLCVTRLTTLLGRRALFLNTSSSSPLSSVWLSTGRLYTIIVYVLGLKITQITCRCISWCWRYLVGLHIYVSRN